MGLIPSKQIKLSLPLTFKYLPKDIKEIYIRYKPTDPRTLRQGWDTAVDDKVYANKGHIIFIEAKFIPNPSLLYKERFCIKSSAGVCQDHLT